MILSFRSERMWSGIGDRLVRPFMRKVAENTQLFQVIEIDGDELRYEARTATGKRYDTFTLRKRSDRVNELVEE